MPSPQTAAQRAMVRRGSAVAERLVAAVLPRAWRRDSTWHGEEHWRCVAATGLALGTALDGVDRGLVLCFGLLHDTRRENEAVDPGHGPRAEAFAAELRDEGVLGLDDARFAALAEALRLHSDGQVSTDATIGACWDADRLHLPRVLIEPDPERFSTTAAHGRGTPRGRRRAAGGRTAELGGARRRSRRALTARGAGRWLWAGLAVCVPFGGARGSSRSGTKAAQTRHRFRGTWRHGAPSPQ